jgi:hypothetical protein
MGILKGMHSRLAGLLALVALAVSAADWSKPVEIIVDDTICATYKARVDDGGNLVIALTLANGWHTFAMDNQIRAHEKLAGKKALGMDKPTSFAVSGGLELEGPWLQPALTDFSKPELRIFSWGFEKQALFAAKVKRTAAEPKAHIAIRAQACTETICKDINTALDLDLTLAAGPAEPAQSGLTAIRAQ